MVQQVLNRRRKENREIYVDVVGNKWINKENLVIHRDDITEYWATDVSSNYSGEVSKGFITLWFPRRFPLTKVLDYVGYFVKHLSRLGCSSYTSVQVLKKPVSYGYYVVVTFFYPKRKRGILRKIIKYVRKLERDGASGKIEVFRGAELKVIYD